MKAKLKKMFIPIVGAILILVSSSWAVMNVPYLGQVATRCYIPNAVDANYRQACSRTVHISRDDITKLQLVIPNFYVNTGASGVETDLDATMSVTASIEYPADTFHRVTFSGSTTGTVPDGGQLLSDAVSVSIPYDAKFWVRIWYSHSAGVMFSDTHMPITGDLLAYGPTTTDYTMGGTISASTTTRHYTAAAIVGYTHRKSVGIIGDSNAKGVSGVSVEKDGDSGLIAPSIGPVAGYINAAVGGDAATWYAANNTQRSALMAYVSDIIIHLGTNDLAQTRTAAQILTDLNTIIALYPNQRCFVTTPLPRTTSTDNWATIANQTVTATEAARITLINTLRYGSLTGSVTGAAGVFDVNAAVESGYNSGKWDTGTTNVKTTGDGIHVSALGILRAKRLNVFSPYLFTTRAEGLTNGTTVYR